MEHPAEQPAEVGGQQDGLSDEVVDGGHCDRDQLVKCNFVLVGSET